MRDLDPVAQLTYEVAELRRQLHQMIQPATITYVYRQLGEAGIKTDRDDGTWLGYVDVEVGTHEIPRIPAMTLRHGEDKTFWLPSENEKGTLMSPSGDYANAFFAPAVAPKQSERIRPQGESLKQRITQYRDGTTHIYDTDEHTDILEVKHEGGKTAPKGKIVQKVDDAEITIEHDKITLKVSGTGTTAKIEMTGSEIKGEVGTTRFKFNTAKADIRVGASWLVLLPAIANINGFTMATGVTNLIPPGPGYAIVPAGTF